VDEGLRRSLRLALLITGCLGVLAAAVMLLVTLVQFGHSTAAMSLPPWAQWGAAPPHELVMLIVGALCALLLVSDPWPVRVGAAAVAAWFAYAQAAFGPGSRFAELSAQTFDRAPFWTAALVSVAALLAVSVLALALAVRPVRATQPGGDAAAAARP